MPKFSVSLVGYVGRTVDVEADDWESAVSEALNGDEATLSLCHQCAHDWDPGQVDAQAVYDEDDRAVADSKWHPINLVEVN